MTMDNPIKGQHRQGDVLIMPAKIPASATAVPHDGGPVIAAHGEVTGHMHAWHGGAVMFRDDGGPRGGATYVSLTEPQSLTHQEHAPTPAVIGELIVIRQRQYIEDHARSVED